MAEALAKTVLDQLASLTVGLPADYVVGKLKAMKSAKKDLNLMHANMEAICAVLEDAENKGYSNKAINIWVRDLKSVLYDIDDLLDEVAYDAKLRKANEGHFTRQIRYYASSSSPIFSRFGWSHKIEELREKLDYVVAKKDKFGLTERSFDDSSSSKDEIRNSLDGTPEYGSSTAGRDEAKNDILAKIEAVSDATELSVLPIVGMGGIGKTTLAKLVYADVPHFDLKLWVCVSGDLKKTKILEDIVKAGNIDITPNQPISTLVKMVQGLLADKRYFLVLDDVGIEDIVKWKELKDLLAGGKAGSLILITTRQANIADTTKTTNMEQYDLHRLPEHVCWSIFEQLAFKGGEEARYPLLYEIGKSIIKKCGGIPLVVITLGSLLRSERNVDEWQRINEMHSFLELNQGYDKVMQLLKISYDKLPSQLKPCFAHLSLIGKDVHLQTNYVMYMWSALGLLGAGKEKNDIIGCGYSYFMEMVSRSLLEEPSFQLEKLYCQTKMHDLLHDLAMNILGEELSIVTIDKLTVSEVTRHVVWGYEEDGNLEDKEFPKELLKASKARSFQFSCRMRSIHQSFVDGIISHFKCLRILDLNSNWLEELPRSIEKLKHLRYLDLSYNPVIRTLPNTIGRLVNLELLRLHGCVELKEIPKQVFQLQSLRRLTVTTRQRILFDTTINLQNSLQSLLVDSCKNLESLWEDGNAGSLTCLRILRLANCPKLTRLPKSMELLVSLEVLLIDDCEMLDLQKAEWLQSVKRLRALQIKGVPNLKFMPEGIQYAAASLEYLYIYNCVALLSLPDWLQYFHSLRRIFIQNCPNICGVPWVFRHLKSLQLLLIEGSPHLSEWFTKLTIGDYDIIQHIPKVWLDGIEFTHNHGQ